MPFAHRFSRRETRLRSLSTAALSQDEDKNFHQIVDKYVN
ncbi:hypothetical protein C7S15_4624 [Burkholderia cepacia]|nr:hypothetical protein [Burkholderia cepacia]